jgi:adenosylcobinamide-GDP ribazoletransferase
LIGQARLFLCALQLLTRLPLPRIAFEPDWIARSSPYYPVVGWIVGALSAGVLLLASRLWPGFPAAVIALAAGLLVTGGFHEDGLADTADGLGGGQTPARRLEIMKDSRVGTYGVLATWSVLGLKAAALATMSPAEAALALLLAHGAARAFPVLLMAGLPYAGDVGAAKLEAATGGARPREAIVAMIVGVAPLLLFPSPLPAALGLVLAAAATLALARTARRFVGGFTGDILGAAEQLAEAALLLGFAARLG